MVSLHGDVTLQAGDQVYLQIAPDAVVDDQGVLFGGAPASG
jgi:hypothetical protein